MNTEELPISETEIITQQAMLKLIDSLIAKGQIIKPRSEIMNLLSKNRFIPEEYVKKCSRCGEIKTYDNFNKDKKAPTGLYSMCKICKLKSRRHL